jgi:DNA-binding transcriptional regulator YiaG
MKTPQSRTMTAQEFRTTIRALGISQRALAKRLGLAVSTVNRWAVGEAPVPEYAIAFIQERRKLRDIAEIIEKD